MATKTSSRPRLGFLIAAAFALSATVLPTKVKAANYFYDNSGSQEISDSNNWYLDPGLVTPAPSAPSSLDGLFIGFSPLFFSSPGSNGLINDPLSGGVFASLNFSDSSGFGIYLVDSNSLTLGSISSTSGSYDAIINTSSLTLTGASTITAGAGSDILILPSVSGSSLTVAGAGTTTLNSGISLGAGGLTKQGSGQLVVDGVANYTGTTTVAAAGRLTFSQDAFLTGQVTNDGTLDLLGTSSYSTIMSLAGSGVTNLSGHAIIVTRSGSGTLNLTLDSRINNLTQTGTISIAGAQVLEVYEGNYAGDLVGAGAFRKLTVGNLTLSGDNSGLLGNMEIAAGVLRAESIDALGAGTIKLTGGDLTLVSDVSQIRANNVEVSADTTITLEAFTPATLSLIQTLGDLTVGAYELTVAPGSNFDLGATSTLAFGNVTLDSAGGTSTFNIDTGARLTTNNVTSFANESLTVDGAGTTVISGTLDLGAGNLTKNGAGDMFVVNAVSGAWTGSTTVNAGTLQFYSPVTLAGQVTNNATLNFTSTGGITSLQAGLDGSGVTTFSGEAAIATYAGTGSLTLNDLTFIQVLNGSGTITFNNAPLVVSSGISGASLAGNGLFVKNSGANLILTGTTSAFTGQTLVTNGAMEFTQGVTLAGQVTNDAYLLFSSGFGTTATLTTGLDGFGFTQFAAEAVIGTRSGSGDIVFAENATIGTLVGAGTITIGSGKTLDVSSGTFSGTLQGSGGLSKSGSGTLNMSGLAAVYYAGSTTVNAGTLQFDSAVSLTGQVTNNASLLFNSGFGTTNTLTAGLDGSGFTTFTGEALIGTRDGSGSINFQENATISFLLGSGTITMDPGKTLTVSNGEYFGALQGAGNLTKSAGGVLWMRGVGAGDYTGTTTVNSGALVFTSAVTLAGQVTNNSSLVFDAIAGINQLTTGLNGSGSTVFYGDSVIGTRDGNGFLALEGNSTINTLLGTGSIFIGFDRTLNVSTGSFSGELYGPGSLSKSGPGTLIMSGLTAANYTGTTTVNSGTLEFDSAVSLAGQVTNNATLNFTDVLGTAALLSLGGSGNTVFSGDATIGTFTGSGLLTLNGATEIGSLFGTGTVDIASGKTLTVSNGDFFGTLQGAGNLAQTAGGVLRLFGPGAGDYTGTTTVNSGLLLFDSAVTLAGQVTNNSSLAFFGSGLTQLTTGLNGSGFTEFLDDSVIGTRDGNGTLALYGNSTINTLLGTGSISIGGGRTLTVSTGNFSGDLNGTGSLSKSGPGTLFMNGLAAANYTGTTTVNSGTLEFDSDVSLAGQVTNNATLNFTSIAGVTQLQTGLNGTGTTTFSGDAFIGTRSGSGTLNLNGDTEITSLFGTGTITIAGGKTVDVSNGSFSGILAGAGSLSKSTAGVLTLTNANTFSGQVDVYAGTLITANNGLQNVPQIYVHASGTLSGVNYKTDADLAIDQGGTATFSAAASAITGTIWNNGNLTLNPALGGNSTITLNEFYGSGTTTITRGNLTIYNNALTLGTTVLDPFTVDNTLPADLTWGYGAGGGGNNVLNLIGTLTADISGGTVNTTNLLSNYIFDVDMLGDVLNGSTGRPLGISGPAMGGSNVYLNVNVSGAATVGRIVVDGTGTVNFAGTAEVVTLENGAVNLTGTLGEFTNVEGGVITSTSADVKITHLTGGTHSFNGQSTTITNFTGGVATLNGVQALVTNFGGNATATATSNISVGAMNGGSLTLQGSGPSSFITRLNGGTLNIDGSDVLVTVNAGNSPAIGAGATIIGNGSLTKLTVATLNLNTINLSGTTRHQEGVINVSGANNSLGTVINSSTLNFFATNGQNSIASLQSSSTGVINFATDSSIGEVSGSGVLTINDFTKTLTIQSGSFSGTISGDGNLFKSNTGILVLAGTNVDNYTGETTINGGTLEFSSAVTLTGPVNNSGSVLRFTSATGTTTVSSLTNNFGGSTIFTGASSAATVLNANGASLQFNGSTNITVGLLNLTGSYVEINAGGTINILSGDGVTRINNAGVSINQRVNDGELQVYGSSSINQLAGNGRITLGSALSVNEGATSGTIDGNGSLTKNGIGLLTLSGANVDNYTGNTNVYNGTLVFDHDAIYLAGQVSVGGSGTLNFSAATGTTWINNYVVNYGNTSFGSNAILGDTYNYANTITVAGNLTGTYLESNNGGATITVGGVASLNHLRNYAGQVNINGLIGSSSIGLIQNYGGSITIIGNANVSDVRTYGGATSIGGNLINCNILENNANTQVSGDASISSLRNYSGTTNIGGNLVANDVVNNGGQLIVVTGNANISSYLTNDGNVNFGAAATITNLYGSGTTNFAGLTQISNRSGNGTANFSDDASIASIADNGTLSIVLGKTLTLSNGSFSGSISGQGALNKTTGNTLTLAGSNVDGYQGVTTVNAGTLVFDTDVTLLGRVTNDATLNFTSGSGLTELTTGLAGSGSTSFAGNTQVGTLDGTIAATVSIASDKTLTVSNGNYAGTLTGGGSLVKANGGTLALTGNGAGNYSGTTTVGAGTLTFTQAVTLGAQVTNNGTLNFTNAGNAALSTGLNGSGATSFSGDTSVGVLDGTNTAAVSIAVGKVLTVNSGDFAGSLTGGGSLVKATGGNLTLTGNGAGNYTGTTTVDNGTLTFTQNVNLVGQVTNNATLNFNGAGTSSLTTLVGSGTTTFAGNATIENRSDAGVVNFLGDVTIELLTGSGDLNIATNKELIVEQGSYTGSITGSGDLVKTTAGQLTLSGSASSFGATLVQDGLLTVNSDVTTTGVTVAAGASLGGSGSINGNVVVNGFLAPGNSPGILTVTGTETLANGSSFLAEIGGTQAGTGDAFHDQSNVVGNVVIGTGVTLDILSWNGFTSVSRGDTLTLVKATGGISGRFADTAGSGLTGWTLFDNSSDAAHQFGNLYGTGLGAAQTFGAWGTNANRTAVAGALWTTAVTETTNSATTAGANRVGFIDTNSNAGRAALALVNAGANTDALLDSYSPESFLGLSDYAQMTARTLADGALNQTTSYTLGDWGVGAGYSSVANTYTAGSSSAFDRRLSSNTTYANFSYHLNPRWKAGLFFGHNVGRINSAANSTNINGNVVGLSLNGSVDWHYPVSLKAAISSSSLRFGSNRSMVTATSGDDQIVSGTGTSSSADNKLTDTSAQVSASMLVYTKGRLSLSPSVGLVYGTSKTDAFTETGTGANLAVAGMSSNSTRGVLGLGVGYEVSAELALSMSLGLEKQLNSNAESVSATFAGARDANFSVTGRDTSGSVISTLGLGVSYRLPEGYSANLSAEFRSANPFHNDKRVNLSINRRF